MLCLVEPPANVVAPRRCALCAAVFGLLASLPAAAQVHYNAANDHYYERVSAPSSTWQQANAAALARTHSGRYGHLVTITSVQERDFVASKFGSTPLPLWLGGYRSTTSPNPALGWYWVTGEAWSFTSWFSGEPNNTGGQENYLMLAHSPTTWNDCSLSCGAAGYIVEYPPAPANGWGDPYFTENLLQGTTVIITQGNPPNVFGATTTFTRKSAGGSTSGGFARSTSASAQFSGAFAIDWRGMQFVSSGVAELHGLSPGESATTELLGSLTWKLERDYRTDMFPSINNVEFDTAGDPSTGRSMLVHYTQSSGPATYLSSGPYSVNLSLNASPSFSYESASLSFPLDPLGYTCGLTGWSSRGTQSFGQLSGTPLVYDTAGARLLTVTSDNPVRTVSWNGSTWTVLATGGVTPRTGPALAYDSIRSRVVLFGGVGLTDTWEWNGTSWSQKSPAGTIPHHASPASMVFHTALGEIVLLALEANANEFCAFLYNGTRWAVSHPLPFNPSQILSSCYEPVQQAAVYFVQGNGVVSPQMWSYTAQGWLFKGTIGTNSAISVHFDPRSNRLVAFDQNVYPSSGPNTYGATLEWTANAWKLMSVRSPALKLFGRMLAGYDAGRSQLVAVIPQSNGSHLLFEHNRAENPFVTIVSNLVRQYGKTAQITPVIEIVGDKTFEWRRNGVAIPPNPRYHIDANGVLSIDSFRHSDTGSLSVAVIHECGIKTTGGCAVSGYFACPGDINFDGFVDDADFVTFVAAYDTLFAPPANEFADLNSDWLVDDADFQAFALRYNDLLCP